MDLEDVKIKMAKVMEVTKVDMAGIRTGRATTALVENIVIGAYGGTAKMKVLELATITVPDAQSLMITPYDNSIIGDIRRDIEAANVGLTPRIDNNVIRVSVPALTTERREEFVKMAHKKMEDARVKARQVRHEKMGEIKRAAEDKTLNEDEVTKLEEDLQKITDKIMEEIELLGKAKETELMTV